MSVHIGWCDPDCPSRYSRYVAKFHDIPRFSLESDGWKAMLQELLKSERFDLVIPCGDPSIIPLQEHRKDFETLAPLYLLDDEVFRITYNKRETTVLARKLGIPVPEEVELTSAQELAEALQRTALPMVLKPLCSFTPDNLDYHHDVLKAFGREEAERLASGMLSKGPVLLQENFIGQGTGVELIADKGEILSAFQHLRLHEPPHGGAGTYRKSVALHPDLYAAAAKFIAALNYTGVAMLEFKLNPETGRWVFLEINARFWGSLPLAVAAGIDFPWYLYQLLVYGKREFNKTYRVGLYCRDLMGDIDWFRSNRGADHSDPYLHTVPTWRVLGELANMVTLKERSDTFTVDDPYPALMDIASWVRSKYRGLMRKIGIRVRSHGLIKRFARRKVVRALCHNKTILYVCTGNICRSPFAQYATQSLLAQEISAFSAGILFQDGRRCPVNAIAAAQASGVDLTGHVATQITENALLQAGVVFVFDTVAYEYLKERFPLIRGKIHYLGVFLDDGQVVIDDPIGGDLSLFRTTYSNIASAVNRLKEALDRCQSPIRATR
jgi:protein-tyrosine-phosphatase/predicted ATP-grasp superfamily ATP-dependent carboligase